MEHKENKNIPPDEVIEKIAAREAELAAEEVELAGEEKELTEIEKCFSLNEMYAGRLAKQAYVPKHMPTLATANQHRSRQDRSKYKGDGTLRKEKDFAIHKNAVEDKEEGVV